MVHRRNVIVVVGHGLRSDALGDSRAWPLSTPNFEKLAERGIRLVATSACPSDPGGLISLFTGLHARQHGHLASSRSRHACDGWPAQLASAGYHVTGVGRIACIEPWLTESVRVEDVAEPAPQGCMYMQAIRGKGLHKAIESQRRQRLRHGPFEPDRLLIEPEDDIDSYIMQQARQSLARMPKDRPWALIVCLTGPGNDLPPPMMYDQIVRTTALEDGFTLANFRTVDSIAELDYPRSMLQMLDPLRLSRIRADYLGRVSLMDFGLGQLEQTRKDRADCDRTWLLVGSDHGYLLGEQGLIGHRSFLSAAVETPLLLVPPTQPAQSAFDCLSSTVDIAATIAELCAADRPEGCVGRSVLDLMREQPLSMPAEVNLSEFGDKLMLETARHKMVFNTQTGKALALFDLLNDPHERTNLKKDAVGLNLIDSLRWRLTEALLPLRSPPR